MNLEEISLRPVRSYVPLTKDEKDMVSYLAETGKPIHKIASILQKDTRLFKLDFKREGTDVRNAYDKGLEMAITKTNEVTLENARKGNITAKQIMDNIWEEQRIENIKQEIFNSE